MMYRPSPGGVTNLPTVASKPEAKVLILGVHKELFIEDPDFIKGQPSEHQASAVDPIDPAVKLIMIGHWSIGPFPVPRIQPTHNPQKLEGLIEWSKKVSGVGCFHTVEVNYAAAGRPAAVIQMNGIAKCAERIRREARITVKQQNQRCGCGPDALVARKAKAQISLVENSSDLWVALADGFRTTIAGVVVDHDDLNLCGDRALDNGS
jgi:hypothetical protein